ncbi:protein of unknown function DUF262 [Denitrovibrio acetiphilus DSM 12809]|uniref:GmrSD restriction endonucleases N-terminal domain-containing protein n=1 Tax=Denitrovibrio acetiphilus (strain DSM 12809 / NBRC 114555 / N2460) TaxID=522772 RepID=D4H5L4_DENA2|nr:DUF262 domain-containing protein [Denitrovibrio acetiphilus]ADD69455.1 protein of unknown function DUF262 [Denitrovibrio acetiphilus DSM 12809]
MPEFSFPRNTKTVKEICDDFDKGILMIDETYQRRKVWIEKDRIRLIETIILGFIVPELYLWTAETDPKSGDTIRHIVDGQQRINAIVDFVEGAFKLSSTHMLDDSLKDLYGNKYFTDLPDEIRSHIWSYDLSIVNIDKKCTRDDIIKLFNRLNLTEYNLNSQEKTT